MPVVLTTELMKRLYPKITDRQARAFVDKQATMRTILATPERAALCFANIGPETGMFNPAVVKNLTENIYYSHAGMAKTWRNRFGGDPNRVIAKYGADAGWRARAINDIYMFEPDGKTPRMGNRPGTQDGVNFIGRGAPQVTGRDGYQEISKRTGKDFVNNPQLMTTPELQPEITQAFWDWKGFNRYADRLNGAAPEMIDSIVSQARRIWNGGTNGLKEVQTQYPRMFGIIRSYKPETAVPDNAVIPVPATTRVDEQLRDAQSELIRIGYYEVGEADGVIGGKTLGGIQAFFNDRGLDISQAKWPSQQLLQELAKAKSAGWHRPIAPGRAYATENEVAAKVPSIAPVQAASWWQKLTALFGGATIAGGGATKLVDTFTDAKDTVSPYWYMVQDFFPTIPQMFFLAVVIAVSIYTIRKMNQANKATVEEYQKGRIN